VQETPFSGGGGQSAEKTRDMKLQFGDLRCNENRTEPGWGLVAEAEAQMTPTLEMSETGFKRNPHGSEEGSFLPRPRVMKRKVFEKP
jgi:hypothetical protein